MNLSSPTYMPTCVTPAPGRAEKSRMSPGRSGSMTGVPPAPPTPDVPPHASQSHRHPDAQAYALVCVAARTPETPRPTILEPIAHLRADAEPAEWSPLDPATDAPLRRELLRGRVSREAEGQPRERVGAERGVATPRL